MHVAEACKLSSTDRARLGAHLQSLGTCKAHALVSTWEQKLRRLSIHAHHAQALGISLVDNVDPFA